MAEYFVTNFVRNGKSGAEVLELIFKYISKIIIDKYSILLPFNFPASVASFKYSSVMTRSSSIHCEWMVAWKAKTPEVPAIIKTSHFFITKMHSSLFFLECRLE